MFPAAAALPWWAVLPLAAVLVYVLSFTVRAAVIRFGVDWPLSPWESALVVDGWRITRGEAVYQMPADGPATQMYGPLGTYLVGAIFELTGPTLWVPRAVPLAATIGSIALAGWVVGRRSGIVAGALGAMLVGQQFFKAQASMTRARPDTAAAALAFAALVLLYQGHRRDRRHRWAWTAAGCAAMVTAFGFKQPAAIVAVVPLMAEMAATVGRRRIDWPSLRRACVPPAVLAATLVALRVGWPTVWFYMAEVPAMYGVRWELFFPALLASSLQYGLPLYVAILFRCFAPRDGVTADATGRVDAWCVSAAALAFASGVLSWAKVGGQVNSMLPFFLASGFYAAVVLPDALRRLPSLAPIGRVAATAALAALLVLDGLGVRKSEAYAREVVAGHGDEAYRLVIGHVQTLPGKVICPLDPTVELFAFGTAGRNLYLETDAAGDRLFRPPGSVAAMRAADWLVFVNSPYRGVEQKELFAELGYKKQKTPPGWEGSVYSLWKRGEPRRREDRREEEGRWLKRREDG